MTPRNVPGLDLMHREPAPPAGVEAARDWLASGKPHRQGEVIGKPDEVPAPERDQIGHVIEACAGR